MRKNYPLLSAELNDIFQDVYAKLVYVIGYDSETGKPKFKGQYDLYEERIRIQINSIIFTFISDEQQPVYKTWSRHTVRNELRRL